MRELDVCLQAGKRLKSEGFTFDRAYTSVLKRCIVSLHTVLEELEQLWIPEEKCWRLNERHYGGLQDQVKSEVAQKVGEKQAKEWRRSYACQPPGTQIPSTSLCLRCAHECACNKGHVLDMNVSVRHDDAIKSLCPNSYVCAFRLCNQ